MIAAEPAYDKVEEEDHLQENASVEVIFMQQHFPSEKLGPVLEKQVSQAVQLAYNDVRSCLNV